MEDQILNDLENTIESIASIMEGSVSRDVIKCVAESVDGDMNLALDAIMNILEEGNKPNVNNNMIEEASDTKNTVASKKQEEIQSALQDNSTSQMEEPSSSHGHNTVSNLVLPVSYAAISNNMGTTSQITAAPNQTRQNKNNTKMWCDDFRKIISYHCQGYRTLVLMRGAPGSGKTYMAKKIVENTVGSDVTDFKSHIFSTDDFFMINNVYRFNKMFLKYFHNKNQERAKLAMEQGVSPVIIDNTNIEDWEMKPYVAYGVLNGYYIIVFDSKTSWAKNAFQCYNRNIHNVPIANIRRMLSTYHNNVTLETLLKSCPFQYPIDKTPPIMRNMPAVTVKTSNLISENSNCNISQLKQSFSELATKQNPNDTESNTLTKKCNEVQEHEKKCEELKELQTKNKIAYSDVQKQLDEINKIEQEWENGDDWKEISDNESVETNSSFDATSVNKKIEIPKPQRSSDIKLDVSQKFGNLDQCEDWATMFMPTFDDKFVANINDVESSSVETCSNSTCVELGDTDNKSNIFKVIIASPRDINEFYVSDTSTKNAIPKILMLHKSTMTNENVISSIRCKYEKSHFRQLTKLFPKIPKTYLSEVFDKCQGDVNWAVSILLDSDPPKQLEHSVEELSDSEEEGDEGECNCLAAYDILPDKTLHIETEIKQPSQTVSSSPLKQKKQPKEVSEDSLKLKQFIEESVVLGDNHYSDRHLRLVKKRRGEPTENPNKEENQCVYNSPNSGKELLNNDCDCDDDNDDLESVISVDEIEKTVNINVGNEFIKELDVLFGRRDMSYPSQVLPKMNIPVSLLNQINEIWIESLMHQLDEHDKQTSIMLQQDAELARLIYEKEIELQGKEPDVPDFKEIMDMELALSLYQKDIKEYLNKEPKDLAAILSREKLCNLFPGINKEVLHELLMAHDNNFQATVEGLLISTGQAGILSKENGLNKFIVNKEMEIKKKKIEEEKKALSEVEWPLLPCSDTVGLDLVEDYRNRAERHLISRNMSHNKADEYLRRGMYQVASHYNELASFHYTQYEHCNSLAAISLIQYHARNNPGNVTLDLHFLRVPESIQASDLFLDMHIDLLRRKCSDVTRELYVITGWGRHSNGKPKIKPAVEQRLTERAIEFKNGNRGLLQIKINARDAMTHELH